MVVVILPCRLANTVSFLKYIFISLHAWGKSYYTCIEPVLLMRFDLASYTAVLVANIFSLFTCFLKESVFNVLSK